MRFGLVEFISSYNQLSIYQYIVSCELGIYSFS
jgi:hypothetical protein